MEKGNSFCSFAEMVLHKHALGVMCIIFFGKGNGFIHRQGSLLKGLGFKVKNLQATDKFSFMCVDSL